MTLSLYASPLKLATGEYLPYTGENLIGGGISTQIVRAVFKEIKEDVEIDFRPWNRVMSNLKSASFSGSFPWNKNATRQIDFFYSEAIHNYKITSFVKKGSLIDRTGNLKQMKLCNPSGWDISNMLQFIKDNEMIIESPISLESCFSMLKLDRVDVIITNDLVGTNFIHTRFPKDHLFTTKKLGTFDKMNNLYFIVPKKYPNAQKIIADFNRGLKIIKKNGTYDKIMNTQN
jgi:polar amino acid transport system substrate-binding protein